MYHCDISNGDLTITLTGITCGSDSNPYTDQVSVSGSSSLNSIYITDVTLALHISSVTLSSPTPFLINSSDVTVSFFGSSLFAASAAGSAGIECSGYSTISFSTNDITSELKATGATGGAGIGTSQNGACGYLSFWNGTVIATGGAGAPGIGSGRAENGNSTLDHVHLYNGTFTIAGTPGYGAGDAENGRSRVNKLHISAGDISVTGIGAGHAEDFGESSLGELLIFGGRIQTTGRPGSAGLGAGSVIGLNSISRVENLLISAGDITATGDAGAGIGSGHAQGGLSAIETLSIDTGFLRVRGTSGIGAGRGDGSSVERLVLGGSLGRLEIECEAEGGPCLQARSVTLVNQTLAAVTNTTQFLGMDIDLESEVATVDWLVRYRNLSLAENIDGFPVLHLANLAGLTDGTVTVEIRQVGGEGFVRSVKVDPEVAKGLLSSVPSGDYEIKFLDEYDDRIGYLCAGNTDATTLNIGGGEVFYPDVRICQKKEPIALGTIIGIAIGIAFVVLFNVMIVLAVRARGCGRRDQDKTEEWISGYT
jgi:hypothetical protein